MNKLKFNHYLSLIRKNINNRYFLSNLPARGVNYIKYKMSKPCATIDNTAISPIYVSILSTKRCNLKCPFCIVRNVMDGQGVDSDLSLSDLERIISHELIRKSLMITFTGGEPLLNKSIWEMVDHVKKHGFFCNIVTNGTLLRRHFEKLRSSKLDFISVSVYDENIEVLAKDLHEINKVFPVRLNRVLRRSSMVDDVRQTLELALQTNCLGVLFQHVMPGNESWNDEVISQDNEEYLSLIRKVTEEYGDKVPFSFPKGVDWQYSKKMCRMPWYLMVLDNKGNLGMCCRHQEAGLYGNLFKDSMEMLRNQPVALKTRADLLNDDVVPKACQFCPFLTDEFSSDI